MKKHLLALAGALALAWGSSAAAQFAKPEDAVKYRKATFIVMAAHTGRMGQMAQGKVPFNAKDATENAEVLALMAKMPWTAFHEDTMGVDSKAKDEVWTNAAKFKQKAEKFEADTQKLLTAAKTGKEDVFKAAFTAASGGCKSCHDDFRSK